MLFSIPLDLMIGSGFFYTCDETWNQEEEISLLILDVPAKKIMSDYQLSDILDKKHKILYVYDFINMWTFL
jgi:hypothetical protein